MDSLPPLETVYQAVYSLYQGNSKASSWLKELQTSVRITDRLISFPEQYLHFLNVMSFPISFDINNQIIFNLFNFLSLLSVEQSSQNP